MKKIKNNLYRLSWKMQQAAALIIIGLANVVMLSTVNAAGITGVTSVDTLNSVVLCPIFEGLFDIFMVVSVIMILWAAFTYMRAQDDAEKVTQATKTITYAAVGIVVALVAKVFPEIVSSIVSGGVSNSPC
jgi:hypothetical protein